MPLSDYDPIFQAAGQEWNVDPLILKAMMGQESGGRTGAVSGAGAQGLMQIIPETQRALGITNPWDPAQSIFGAAKYLSQALNAEGGDPAAALFFYHGGPGWRSQFGPESKAYVPAVAARYQQLVKASAPAATALGTSSMAKQSPGTESDDAFLARTGASQAAPTSTTSASAPETDETFLARTGAASRTPSTAERPTGAAPLVSTAATSQTGWPLFAAPAPGAVGRIAEAAREGWEKTPSLLTPEAQASVEQSGIFGRELYGPAARVVGGALGAGGALIRGGQQFLSEAVSPISPALGRDIAAVPEAFAGGPSLLEVPTEPSVPSAPPSARFVQEYYGEGTPANPLAVAPSPREGAFVPPGTTTAPRPAEPPAFVPPGTSAYPPHTLRATEAGPYASRGNILAYGAPGPEGQIGGVGESSAAAPTPEAAAGGQWRPVGPNEVFQPGRQFRMNQTTGQSEVFEPSRQTGVPAADMPQAGSDQAWLGGLGSDVQRVINENQRILAQNAGAAATPAEQARLSTAQMKANRRMAELNEIVAPPKLGEDTTIYVPGSEPTLAERAGDPQISQRETVLRQRNPNEFEGAGKPLTEANAARVKAFDDMAGTDPQIATLRERQREQASLDTANIMRQAGPVNLQPVADQIDGLLNDPRIREREDVVQVLTPLRASLYDEAGNLKSDPQAVWGMHDNLMTKLDKAKDRTSSERFALTEMNSFKKALDGAMNQATNGGFQTFLDNQARYFQQINALDLLQKYRPRLTDAKGNINAAGYHRWLTDLAIRRGKPGVDPAMDIPDETMRGLIDIDNDMKRASRIDLGKPRGSPTNLFFEVARAAGLAGAHALMGAAVPSGVGNVLLHHAVGVAAPRVRQWRLNRLTRQHLAPPPGGYTPNPLRAPPTP